MCRPASRRHRVRLLHLGNLAAEWITTLPTGMQLRVFHAPGPFRREPAIALPYCGTYSDRRRGLLTAGCQPHLAWCYGKGECGIGGVASTFYPAHWARGGPATTYGIFLADGPAILTGGRGGVGGDLGIVLVLSGMPAPTVKRGRNGLTGPWAACYPLRSGGCALRR